MKSRLAKILPSVLLFTNLAVAADPTAVTAIDILLEPDATMLEHATANNGRLPAVFPKATVKQLIARSAFIR